MFRSVSIALGLLLMLQGQASRPASGQARGPAPESLSGMPPAVAPTPVPIAGFDVVGLRSAGVGGATIGAYLKRPAAAGPRPVVIGLHGCGGLVTRLGGLQAREDDWTQRLVELGYAVLLPDSFNARGYRQICTLKERERQIRPGDRVEDVAAAITWLAEQDWVDSSKIALIGWSHGGSSVLWSIRRKALGTPQVTLKTAIAFYPGCRVPAESTTWAPRIPLTILIGAADDWTPSEPCRVLAANHPITLVEYPGAVHGFDAPNLALRTRTDVGLKKDGRAKVGTDPKARAAAIELVQRILADAFK